MKFFSKVDNNGNYQIGELLKITNPKSGWRKKVNKNISSLVNELDSEFVIAYDFNEVLLKEINDDIHPIGKRVYIPCGTNCLYLSCDLITTKDLDPEEEDIVFELHRVLVENKSYWIFDIFLQKK